MVRSFFLSISFLVLTLITLFVSIFFLQYTFDKKTNFQFGKPNYKMYSALPETNQEAQGVSALNVKVEVVERFLANYRSPLTPYAEFIVNTSDSYNLDYRLIPAVAMQESNLCKKIPDNSYNCWGYGIHGGKILTFSNYQEAIQTVAKGLAENYKAKGLETPQEIMTKYTPSNSGDWAFAVEHFMEQLKIF